MEGYCSTGQSPQWAVVPMEEGRRKCNHSNHRYVCSMSSVSLFKTLPVCHKRFVQILSGLEL